MSTSCRGIDPRGHLDYPGRLHHRSRVYVGRTERFPCLPRYSAAALGPGDPDIELAYKFEADAARVAWPPAAGTERPFGAWRGRGGLRVSAARTACS
jgi:hypothetical protein